MNWMIDHFWALVDWLLYLGKKPEFKSPNEGTVFDKRRKNEKRA